MPSCVVKWCRNNSTFITKTQGITFHSVPPERNLSSAVASICNDYFKHSSLHGFYYFYKSANSFVHFVWSVIILASIVLCGYLGWMIFQKFVVDPTLTVVESIHYPMSEIPFPAVTICDPDVVYAPSTGNITKILTYRGYNWTQISEFYRSFTDVKQKVYTPALYLNKMHEMLENLGYPLNVLLDLLKKPCEALLVSCVWRTKVHDCNLMFREKFLVFGYCCQFDMNYFQRNADPDTTFISGTQITEGLDITVDGKRYLPKEKPTEGYLSLYIFDHQDYITFLDNSVSITPSSYFDVNVAIWIIDTSDYVKALSVKSRKCILQSDATYGTGFYQGCLVQNIMRRVVEICRCIPFHYTEKELGVLNKKPCTWERLSCIYENIDKVLGNMRSVIIESECYQRCDFIRYETNVKHVRQQRNFDNFKQGYSRIMIHFVENTCLKYRREVLYTWDQVLANLGGIFGLCLGGSIISIIELAWFLCHLLFTVIKSCVVKKVTPMNQKHEEFDTKMANRKYKFTH